MNNTDEPQINDEVPATSTEPDELSKTKQERDEYLQGWQRAKADFINYKKDETKRLEEFGKYQAEKMIKEFLTVVDSFDLAIATMERASKVKNKEGGDGQDGVDKGIYMIRAQMEDLLRRRDVTRITVKPGDAFDLNIAEAIAEAESETIPEGNIIEEIESGYRFDEKVIRPARVKVSKGKGQ